MERKEFKKIRTAWILVGSSGFLAVLLGAFGAHALQAALDAKAFDVFRTAVSYQFYHTFAMALSLLLFEKNNAHHLIKAFWTFAVGVLLFSGSLYLYVLSGVKFFAMVTPFGGVCFLIGWLLLILAQTSCTITSR